MRRSWWLLFVLSACASPAEVPTEVVPGAIARGLFSGECGMAGAAALEGDVGCSGVLIHPRVVVYAGHCGTGFAQAYFGSSRPYPTEIATVRCETHPELAAISGGQRKFDVAYCLLAEDALGIPVVPPLAGCETEHLTPGARLVVAGYGDTEGEGTSFGVKAYFEGVLVSADTRTQLVGRYEAEGVPSELCPGDSGGPTYLELPDGTWRVAGLHSSTTAGDCGTRETVRWEDARLDLALDWIEEASGVDVTPCFDAHAITCDDERLDCSSSATYVGGESCTPAPTALSGPGTWGACTLPLASAAPACEAPEVDAGVDGGTSAPDAGPLDAGVDAGPDDAGPDDAAPLDAGVVSTPAEGCSCGASATLPPSALLLPLLLLARRREPRASRRDG